MHDQDFERLVSFLKRVPSVQEPISVGQEAGGIWWTKFALDIEHPLAWSVVQELGHVLNYVSVEERLPTVFKPVSPPPYMNGGPREFLSWVIECSDATFPPRSAAEWLEGRLPKPVEDSSVWPINEGDA